MSSEYIPTSQKPTPTRGVPLKLGGREYRLRYSLRTVREMQEEFGEEAIASGVRVDQAAKVLWFGLRHQEDCPSLAELEDLVDLQNLTECMEALQRALGMDPTPPSTNEKPAPVEGDASVTSESETTGS